MDKLAYWIDFSDAIGIGMARFDQLEEYFGDLELACVASKEELKQARLDSRAMGAIHATRFRASLETKMERLKKYQIQALTYHEPAHPARLKKIYNSSPLIYMRGKLMPRDGCCLAVVGAHRNDMYGQQIATHGTTKLSRDMARQLGRMNCVLVKEL